MRMTPAAQSPPSAIPIPPPSCSLPRFPLPSPMAAWRTSTYADTTTATTKSIPGYTGFLRSGKDLFGISAGRALAQVPRHPTGASRHCSSPLIDDCALSMTQCIPHLALHFRKL